jgi:hypothetical protein
MLILPQTVLMTWTPKTKKYYVEKGYVFTKISDVFHTNVLDLPTNSNKEILLLCDYCLLENRETKILRSYQNYLRYNKQTIKKDCCNSCRPKKVKESNLVNYGVENTNQLESVQIRKMQTNLIIYGGTNCMHSEKVKKKVEDTNMKKYGSKAPAHNKVIKMKIKATNLKKYGNVSPTLNEQVRKKQLAKMKEIYGVEFGMQNHLIMGKARQTLYKNGTVPTSYQQAYIHSHVKGHLNYPFLNYSLDIAFPGEKIYIECDFGGHELQVKLGNKTREKFIKDERNSWYSLYRGGWKEIRIVSKKDKVPTVEVLNKMMAFAHIHLNNGHSWIRFKLDENMVEYNNNNDEFVLEYFDFGELYYKYQILNQ